MNMLDYCQKIFYQQKEELPYVEKPQYPLTAKLVNSDYSYIINNLSAYESRTERECDKITHIVIIKLLNLL